MEDSIAKSSGTVVETDPHFNPSPTKRVILHGHNGSGEKVLIMNRAERRKFKLYGNRIMTKGQL